MNWKRLSHVLFLLISICVSPLSNADTAWIDVRSKLEHNIDSIQGDLRISHNDIVQGINELFPDKHTEIYLYCRSGRRAGKAMTALKKAGYTRVSNMSSIENARTKRGPNTK